MCVCVCVCVCVWGFSGGSGVKNLPAMQERWVSSLGGEDASEQEIATLLQYFFLENSMDRGAWLATIFGVTKSQTRLAHMHVCIYTYIYRCMYVYLHFISTLSLLFLKIKSSPPFQLNLSTIHLRLSVPVIFLLDVNYNFLKMFHSYSKRTEGIKIRYMK